MSKTAEKFTTKDNEVFRFKSFEVWQNEEVMKVSTDAVLLGSWAEHHSNKSILDIGSGTGVLALMMAHKYPESNIIAIDIDKNACHIAKYNVENNGWHNRINIIQDDFQNFKGSEFDLIISNPPFFNRKDLYDQSAKQGMRNELSLPHGVLLRNVSQMVSKQGAFLLILPYLEGLRFVELAEMYSLFPSEIVHVSGKIDEKPKRVLLKLHKSSEKIQVSISSLAIRAKDDSYTENFRRITKDYYQTEKSL